MAACLLYAPYHPFKLKIKTVRAELIVYVNLLLTTPPTGGYTCRNM